jgi:hypothetical protein
MRDFLKLISLLALGCHFQIARGTIADLATHSYEVRRFDSLSRPVPNRKYPDDLSPFVNVINDAVNVWFIAVEQVPNLSF